MPKKWIFTNIMLQVENRSIEEFADVLNIKRFFHRSAFQDEEFDNSYFYRKESHFNYAKYEHYKKENRESFEYYLEFGMYVFSHDDLVAIFLQASKEGFTISIPDENASPLEHLLFEDGKLFKVVENTNVDDDSFTLDLTTIEYVTKKENHANH